MTEAAAAEQLIARIRAQTARVAIVGLGYVGIPLAHAYVSAGFETLGFDIDPRRVRALADGEAYLAHLEQAAFDFLAESPRFEASTDPAGLAACDVVLICVPTPLDDERRPDISAIISAGELIGAHRTKPQLVVLESTTFPGTTRQQLIPALTSNSNTTIEESPLFVAYSAERVDPGGQRDILGVPKVVSAPDGESLDIAQALYEAVFHDVRLASSPEVAEAAKLVENTFRAVNIALVNEIKVALHATDIDVWEVLEAAGSKPFGFLRFDPGPGVGGHCIPVDPLYLVESLAKVGSAMPLVRTALATNQAMPAHVTSRLVDALQSREIAIEFASILVVGVSYKKNVADIRESPSREIISLIRSAGAKVRFHDPYIGSFDAADGPVESVSLTEKSLARFDAVVICTDHDKVDYGALLQSDLTIIDTRNAIRGRGLETNEWVVNA